jgi:3-deoxy-D-manno-octulosonic acid kinase
MTKDGGQRIATSNGAMLADPDSLGGLAGAAIESLFEPTFWFGRGELVDVTGGRGAAWFITGSAAWVLRHYRRGGFIARLSKDRYVWAGEKRVRAFTEWRLLAELSRRGLPVPRPIAARYQRSGPVYRCDLITQRISGARPLSAVLADGPLQENTWRDIGAAVARLHAAGAYHADRTPGEWALKNLSRLNRSLVKVGRGLPADRFGAAAWDWFLAGYARALPL